MPTTRKKTPSLISTATLGGSYLDNSLTLSPKSSNSPLGYSEQESNRRVSELTSELVSLKELAERLKLGEETAAKSKEVLEKRCGELEKTKNDLMEELENLSVELFQEANTMVAEERKARSKAEEESLSLKEEVARLARELEAARNGDDDGESIEGLRRAEEELELVLGLNSSTTSRLTPINTIITDTTLLVPATSISRPLSAIDSLDERSATSTKSWFNFNLGGLKKKTSTSDLNSPTSTTPIPDETISPTARNSSLEIPFTLPSSNDLDPNHISQSRRSSHLSEASTMTTDSNTGSHVSNGFSDASTSAPFPDDLDFDEVVRISGDSFELERKAFRENKLEEHSSPPRIEGARTPTATSPRISEPMTPIASIFTKSSNNLNISPLRTLSPEPLDIDREVVRTFSTDFPPEAAYASSELHGNLASFYPLPPSPTTSSFSSNSVDSNATFTTTYNGALAVPYSMKSTSLRTIRPSLSNSLSSSSLDRTLDSPPLSNISNSASETDFFTPPMSTPSTFPSLYTPPNSDSISTIDSSLEETPRRNPRRPLPIPIEPRSSLSSSTSALDRSISGLNNAGTGLGLGLSRRPSTAALVLQSLNEGKVTPKSPNMARWKDKSSGMTSPPLGSTRRSSASGAETQRSPNSSSGVEWGRSNSEPAITPILSGSISSSSISSNSNLRSSLPVVPSSIRRSSREDSKEVNQSSSISTNSSGPSNSSSYIPTLPSIASSPYSKTISLTSPIKTIPINNSVPLPPGTNSASYTGISPSNSFKFGPSLSSSASTSPTKSFKLGANYNIGSNSNSNNKSSPMKGVDDLDLLMRNIVDMSASLFGDDLEDDEVGVGNKSDEEEGIKV